MITGSKYHATRDNAIYNEPIDTLVELYKTRLNPFSRDEPLALPVCP